MSSSSMDSGTDDEVPAKTATVAGVPAAALLVPPPEIIDEDADPELIYNRPDDDAPPPNLAVRSSAGAPLLSGGGTAARSSTGGGAQGGDKRTNKIRALIFGPSRESRRRRTTQDAGELSDQSETTPASSARPSEDDETSSEAEYSSLGGSSRVSSLSAGFEPLDGSGGRRRRRVQNKGLGGGPAPFSDSEIMGMAAIVEEEPPKKGWVASFFGARKTSEAVVEKSAVGAPGTALGSSSPSAVGGAVSDKGAGVVDGPLGTTTTSAGDHKSTGLDSGVSTPRPLEQVGEREGATPPPRRAEKEEEPSPPRSRWLFGGSRKKKSASPKDLLTEGQPEEVMIPLASDSESGEPLTEFEDDESPKTKMKKVEVSEGEESEVEDGRANNLAKAAKGVGAGTTNDLQTSRSSRDRGLNGPRDKVDHADRTDVKTGDSTSDGATIGRKNPKKSASRGVPGAKDDESSTTLPVASSSIVTDLFEGLLRSKLCCKVCGVTKQPTFEPFRTLSLEIPSVFTKKKFRITFLPLATEANGFRPRPTYYSFEVPVLWTDQTSFASSAAPRGLVYSDPSKTGFAVKLCGAETGGGAETALRPQQCGGVEMFVPRRGYVFY